MCNVALGTVRQRKNSLLNECWNPTSGERSSPEKSITRIIRFSSSWWTTCRSVSFVRDWYDIAVLPIVDFEVC